jgi:hypothetical protein
MPSNLQSLKANYLLLAQIKGGPSLAERLGWLTSEFAAQADDSVEISSVSIEGRSTNMTFRGSTPEQRTTALRLAIEDMQAQIGGDAAGQGGLFSVRLAMPAITLN